MISVLLAVLSLHSPAAHPASNVTIYREIVCHPFNGGAPLVNRFPQLDRPSPLARYSTERE